MSILTSSVGCVDKFQVMQKPGSIARNFLMALKPLFVFGRSAGFVACLVIGRRDLLCGIVQCLEIGLIWTDCI
jgi:hypothetical protein